MIEYIEYNIDTKQYFWIKKYIDNIIRIKIKE